MRDDLVPATVGKVPGAEVAVGGVVAGSVDYAAHVRSKLPLVIGFVLLLTFLVMALTFRSVVVALTSITLNLLSAAAAYGLLVLVFQGTWAEGLLGFPRSTRWCRGCHCSSSWCCSGCRWTTTCSSSAGSGRRCRRGVPNRAAVAEGITGSAGVVTSAAAVMVAVFSIFATLSTIDMKQLGVGLAAAILIDATIIRAVVLPSAMTLLGGANWWAPRFLRRREEQRPTAEVVAPEPEMASLY